MGELLVCGHRAVSVGGQDLDGDMVGATVYMGLETGSDLVAGAVQHKGVDQTVASTCVDVVVGVAVATQIVGVVAEFEIRVGDEWAADTAGDVWVGFEDHLVLRSDDGFGADQ